MTGPYPERKPPPVPQALFIIWARAFVHALMRDDSEVTLWWDEQQKKEES